MVEDQRIHDAVVDTIENVRQGPGYAEWLAGAVVDLVKQERAAAYQQGKVDFAAACERGEADGWLSQFAPGWQRDE